jgi:hypothetical protein
MGYEKIEIGDERNKGSDEKTKLLVIGSGTAVKQKYSTQSKRPY